MELERNCGQHEARIDIFPQTIYSSSLAYYFSKVVVETQHLYKNRFPL